MTAAVAETTSVQFADLIREYDGLDTPYAIAEAIIRDHGLAVFEMLPSEWVIGTLSQRVRMHYSADRRQAFTTTIIRERGQVGQCRIAAAGDYWSKRWPVNGQLLELRQFTVSDLDWLIGEYHDDEVRAKAHALWFASVRALARRHRVKTLAELERKRVELPDVEFALENGS